MTRRTLGIIIAAISSCTLVAVVLATKPKQVNPSLSPAQIFTADEVAAHASPRDCWTIVDGKVYDITSFIANHPGGNEILRACGKDSTELYATRRENGEKIGSGTPHSSGAQRILDELQIGTLTR